MPGDRETDIIRMLSADLAPVRRLASPGWRAAAWLAGVVLLALPLSLLGDVQGMIHRLGAAPDMTLAAIGSALTAILAAIAAFQLTLPDRKAAWALLPLPAAALWIGASGFGCFRNWIVADTHVASMRETMDCLTFILAISIPLSLLLILMLRRGYSLRPNLTAVIGGLACASAAATLLNFIHPFDAAVTDLVVHAIAVGLVVVVIRFIGGRLLADKRISASAM